MNQEFLKKAVVILDALFVIVAIIGIRAIMHGSIIAVVAMPAICASLAWCSDTIERRNSMCHG